MKMILPKNKSKTENLKTQRDAAATKQSQNHKP